MSISTWKGWHFEEKLTLTSSHQVSGIPRSAGHPSWHLLLTLPLRAARYLSETSLMGWKLRPRGVKHFAHSHTAPDWQRRVSTRQGEGRALASRSLSVLRPARGVCKYGQTVAKRGQESGLWSRASPAHVITLLWGPMSSCLPCSGSKTFCWSFLFLFLSFLFFFFLINNFRGKIMSERLFNRMSRSYTFKKQTFIR